MAIDLVSIPQVELHARLQTNIAVIALNDDSSVTLNVLLFFWLDWIPCPWNWWPWHGNPWSPSEDDGYPTTTQEENHGPPQNHYNVTVNSRFQHLFDHNCLFVPFSTVNLIGVFRPYSHRIFTVFFSVYCSYSLPKYGLKSRVFLTSHSPVTMLSAQINKTFQHVALHLRVSDSRLTDDYVRNEVSW